MKLQLFNRQLELLIALGVRVVDGTPHEHQAAYRKLVEASEGTAVPAPIPRGGTDRHDNQWERLQPPTRRVLWTALHGRDNSGQFVVPGGGAGLTFAHQPQARERQKFKSSPS